jgi:hypothetical protein
MGAQLPNGAVGLTPQSSTNNSYDPAYSLRQSVREIVGLPGGSSAYSAQLGPVTDSNINLIGYKLGFMATARICIGWIIDGTAIANCYLVQVEKARAPIIAAALTGTGAVCFGATEINTFSPGAPVLVALHDKLGTGYILGAAPVPLDLGIRAYHDYITQTSRKRVDDSHKKYLKQPNSGQIVDWSAWRPFDATLANEWGAITTTGLNVTLDDFMVKMAVNEFTGVFGFYHDSLLRVGGYNFQTWTGGHERDAYVDQGEYNDYQGYSPYPWEAVGILTPGTDNILAFQPGTYQNTKGKPYYAHWENKHEYQQPYHRTQQYYGYLGQGSRLVVQAPPEQLDRWTYKPGTSGNPGSVYDSQIASKDGGARGAPSNDDKLKDHTNKDKPPIGLHEDNISADGRRFIASAKGITISKRMLLPMPVRLKRPEAGDGDDAAKNYKAGGQLGSGPNHTITGDIETTGQHPHMQRAAGVLDLHGYLFNYAGLHPFHWHEKDYKTYEQDELNYAEYNHRVPDYTQLKGVMYLDQPDPKKIKIDHRYDKQNFYETEAFLSILEDGSVVIGDGYGAEIRMSAGVLTLSAPGDVWIKSGRHSQIWSGGDTVVRSVGNVDVSTTKKSVRIKSEKDVFVLAGNNGQDGGVLIESRAQSQQYDFERAGDDVSFGGVVLRAPNSNVVSVAHQIYLRTGGGGSAIAPGNITIDAGRGEADLVTKSDQLFHYIGQQGQIAHFFRASADDQTQKANYFSKDYTLLTGPLGVAGAVSADGNVACRGNLIATQGHVVTEQAKSKNYRVDPCEDACKTAVDEGIQKINDYTTKVLPQLGDSIDNTYLEGLWYDAQQPGNTRVIDIMEFSFRTDEQYKVFDFMLFEDRWQQMARLANKVPERWTETGVKSKVAGETFPFPGKNWLTETPAFSTQNFGIVEQSDGNLRDKKRNSGSGDLAAPYKNPKFDNSQPQVINGNYPIVGIVNN